MIITRGQLRRIVKEEATRLREGPRQLKPGRDYPQDDEAGAVDLVAEVAPFVADAVADAVGELGQSTCAKRALAHMIRKMGEDGVPVPARIDDIEGWAESVADRALQEPALRTELVTIAKSLLRKLTQPRGS